MIRGLTFIAVGILLGAIVLQQNLNTKNNFLNKLFFTILESCLMCYFLYYSVFHLSSFRVDIYYQLLFIGIFLLFIFNKGLLSKLCNKKTLANLGNYAFSIYLMHFPIILFCQKFIWKNMNDKNCLITTVLLCIFAGIIVYYFIEKPFAKLLTNKCVKNTSNTIYIGGG